MDLGHSEDFDVVERLVASEDDEVSPSIYVKCWERLEVAYQKSKRDRLDYMILVPWWICLGVALVRFGITGDYAPIVAILGVPLTALLGCYYLDRKKGDSKQSNS